MQKVLIALCLVLGLTGCGVSKKSTPDNSDTEVQVQPVEPETSNYDSDVEYAEFTISAGDFIECYNAYTKNNFGKDFFEISSAPDGNRDNESYIVTFESGVGLFNDGKGGNLQLIAMYLISYDFTEQFINDCIKMMEYIDGDCSNVDPSTYDLFSEVVSGDKNDYKYLLIRENASYLFNKESLNDGEYWTLSILPNEDTQETDEWAAFPVK